jgi:hypothetical protein
MKGTLPVFACYLPDMEFCEAIFLREKRFWGRKIGKYRIEKGRAFCRSFGSESLHSSNIFFIPHFLIFKTVTAARRPGGIAAHVMRDIS